MGLDGVVKKSYVQSRQTGVSIRRKNENKTGITLPQSQPLFRLTSVLVPVASCESSFLQCIDLNSCFRPSIFLSIYCPNFVVSSNL